MGLSSIWSKLTGKEHRTLPDAFASQALSSLPFLAVDLELTSLDVTTAKVLSIGWVAGSGQQIDLSSCFYQVIRAKGDLHQSPVIHGLTDEEIRQGEHVQNAVAALRPYIDTHVWVFHNATLDIGVLNTVATNLGIYVPTVVTLDTLKLAVYQLQKQHQVLPPNSATLSVCRDRLDLPAAPAHNALDDALATLTLWFAQQHGTDPKGELRFSDLLHTGAIHVFSLGQASTQ